MARVKLSEYRAKKILVGDAYKGIIIRSADDIANFLESHPSSAKAPAGTWVVKVDQGIKKRFKQGLVAVDVSPKDAERHIAAWTKKGFSQFLLEPYVPHEANEEQYLSLERVREGIRVLHTQDGGIDIEEHPEKVSTYVLSSAKDIAAVGKSTGIPHDFLERAVAAFHDAHFAFLEINPLVIRKGSAHVLDAAVLVDSTASYFAGDAWSDADVVKGRAKHAEEAAVERLAATTPAALSLDVLNRDGALFFLLSGGGGSIVIADEAELRGMGKKIGNYGEYSGGPTREETHLYAREIIRLLIQSKAKRKALVIAGGVANFTDVAKTFAGIIDALQESAHALRKQGVKVFVRRGGPNEREGLWLMEEFLRTHELLGSVYGSDTVITQAVDDAIEFVQV